MKETLKIKDIELKSRVILAPMAGITSFSYRKFLSKYNIGLTFTEMISDCGLIYNNKRTFTMIKSDGSDRPLAIQLFGGSEETLLKGIEILENSDVTYDILDINLACPVPKVTKNNGGSSWLKDVNKMKEMMIKVVNKSSHPVSAKIRLGYEENNVIEIAKALEEAGVSFLTIHCRTKKELYSGTPHYEALSNLKDYIKTPYAVSGNIFTLEDAIKALEITKADAVAIARGGIGNPNLIIDINNYLNDINERKTYTIEEQIEYLKEFSSLLKEEYGDKRATSILRGLAPKFINNFKELKELKVKISTSIDSVDSIFKIIDEYLKNH